MDPSEASLLITEPPFNLPNIQDVYDQFVFEEYEFQAYHRCTPASLIPQGDLFRQPTPECILIVDSGFSFTHVIPIMKGKIMWSSVRRLDVGGKLLTNHLKELVSFRQWNMMDGTHIVNNVKEACCYVSNAFDRDMEVCRSGPKTNPIVQEYVLPDFSAKREGRIRVSDEILVDSEQILAMGNERFCVPEVLFRPSDIGLDQAGLAETINISINTLPEELQGMFWANIGMIGGNANLPGFKDRLMSELRCLAPDDCQVVIYESSDPVIEAFNSGMGFALSAKFHEHVVTRSEYLESGSNASLRKFDHWRTPEREELKERESEKSKEKEKARPRGSKAKPTAEEPKTARTRSRPTRKVSVR